MRGNCCPGLDKGLEVVDDTVVENGRAIGTELYA